MKGREGKDHQLRGRGNMAPGEFKTLGVESFIVFMRGEGETKEGEEEEDRKKGKEDGGEGAGEEVGGQEGGKGGKEEEGG